MRFYLFDRITHFDPGKTAKGVKNISSQEEFLINHYDRQPVMPAPLIIESIAQLGGWSLTVTSAYRYLAIMVMVKDIQVHGQAVPGDQLLLTVMNENMNEYGATISAEARVNANSILSVGNLTYVLYEVPDRLRQDVRARYERFNRDFDLPITA